MIISQVLQSRLHIDSQAPVLVASVGSVAGIHIPAVADHDRNKNHRRLWALGSHNTRVHDFRHRTILAGRKY